MPLLRHVAARRLHVLDDVLLLRVVGRSGLGKRTAVDHHVVLQVLDDQDAPIGIQAQAFVVHPLLLSRM